MTGSVWVKVFPAPPPAGIAMTGGTVTEFVGDGVNGVNGQRYRVHTFTADDTMTVTNAGLAECFLISGGSGGQVPGQNVWAGPGDVLRGIFLLPVGTHAVTVGRGGSNAPGTQSKIGNVLATGRGSIASSGGVVNNGGLSGAGATDSNPTAELTTYIDGTAKGYGAVASATPRANRGDGAQGVGSTGVVIIRYEIEG